MIPAPFSWVAAAALWLVELGWQLVVHISGNVAPLGPWWVVAYWLAVVGAWRLGQRGSAHIRKARIGNDFLEFSGGRARWVGKVALLFELQVKWDAWQAYAVLGYAAALALLAIGALGLWTLALAAGWVALRGWELRRARARRLTAARH